MKKVITILLFGILGALILANTSKNEPDKGIQFFHGTWQEALDKAQKENKLIFMDAYAEWCGPCKLMAKRVFTDEKVGAYFNDHFINVKMDMEKGEGPGLARKFRVNAYPTLFFIDEKGELVNQHIGFLDVADFIEYGESVVSE